MEGRHCPDENAGTRRPTESPADTTSGGEVASAAATVARMPEHHSYIAHRMREGVEVFFHDGTATTVLRVAAVEASPRGQLAPPHRQAGEPPSLLYRSSGMQQRW